MSVRDRVTATASAATFGDAGRRLTIAATVPGGEMTDTAGGDVFDSDALSVWMRDRLCVDDAEVHLEGRPAGGFSAETLILGATITVEGRSESRRFVLRKETTEPAVYPQQSSESMPEIEIQYRVMDSLHRGSDLPLPPLVGYEPDPNVLGTPFFMMGFVDGVVPIESPPYTVEGFFVDADPTVRASMISNGLAALARLHALDVDALDLEWLMPADRPGGRHLLRLWREFGAQELGGRSHPDLETAWQWLERELPADSGVGLCWGDPRPGNIIWSGERPASLTDFEAACIGPPEFDLAWWLMFDRTMHELAGVERLAGDPDRDEQRRLYFDHADRPMVDTTAHEVFAAARYAVIVVRVMNRLDQRGLLPADSLVWRDNPASACLRTYLDELGI